jgi:deazaflavin-dependent oxidoreductase (nitroreductase family)
VTLAKLLRSLTRFRRLQPQVGRAHAAVLRLGRGRLRRSRLLAGGQPVLALTTIGRRSGAPRSTTVAYLRHGEAYAVTALNLGSPRDPAWALNLRSEARAWIYVDGERVEVISREAAAGEAAELWERWIARLPGTANFLSLAGRHVPMIVLDPVSEPEPARALGSYCERSQSAMRRPISAP